ncbi:MULTISPECIES: hypothetical protein [Natrialbaceae]|uniref:hypothetical protein n=1 Tax=Natrialbaceae TaxID=1644061 RepID=UPI00207CFCE6|nr:hypothetical protein [Natronococcus sp. CG52]
MVNRFRDWLGCPACNERNDISRMAHRTDIVLECYECGKISEYKIGQDISIHGLDIDAIAEVAKESTND